MPRPRLVNTLTVERVQEILSYDPDTGVIIRVARASIHEHKSALGKPHVNWQVIIDGVGNSMARIAWAMYYGEWPTSRVLYKDGDGKNIKIANLYLSNNWDNDEDRKNHYRDFYRDHPTNRNKYLIKRFGITLEDYNQLLQEQDFVCSICRQSETETRNGRVKTLAVDHHHETGKPRGLLCAACNKGIGWFRENIQTLERAVEYLQHHERVNLPDNVVSIKHRSA